MSERPLPAVIGPTENALRSLLSRVLASTLIDGYDEWVALNHASGGGNAVVSTVAAALKVDVSTSKRVLERLATKGLVTDLRLTPTGEAQLVDARGAVAAVTATLVEGIDERDQQTARTVLDAIRERAEVALARA
jgi:DNA-binding MarR family transcriptional regulator